jgi:hypothetical protein
MGRHHIVISKKSGVLFSVVFVITALFFLHLGSNKIAYHLVTYLKESIHTHCDVETSSINFFSHFPYTAISLHDVNIEGKEGSSFVDDGSVTFLIHPFKALWGDVDIRQLKLTEGHINIVKHADGFNYQVFGDSSQNTEKDKNLLFYLRKATLSNLRITYRDPEKFHDFSFLIQSGTLNGHVDAQILSFDTDILLKSRGVTIGKNMYFKHSDLAVKGGIEINLYRQLYSFHNVSVSTGETQCTIDGTIRDWSDHQSYRLDFRLDNGVFNDLLSVIPKPLLAWNQFVKPVGRFSAKGKLSGRSSHYESPHLQLSMVQEHGSLVFPKSVQKIDQTSYSISFDNGGARNAYSSTITLEDFEGYYMENKIQSEIQVKHLNFPILNGSLKGTIPAAVFNTDTSVLFFRQGSIDITSLEVKDLWLELITPTSLLQSIDCSFSPQAIQLLYQGKEFVFSDGEVELHDGIPSFEGLSFSTGRSSGSISGKVASLGESIERRQHSMLHYQLRLNSDLIILDDFFEPGSNTVFTQGAACNARYINTSQIKLPSGNVSGKIKKLKWLAKSFDNVDFAFQSTQQSLEGDLLLQTAQGKVEANVRLLCDQNYHIDSRIAFENVDLKACFSQWNNFGQSLIKNHHLSGKVDGHLWLETSLDRFGGVNSKDLHAVMGIQVIDGALQNFEMLDQFSRYINIKDLRDLRFAKLQNYLEVKNGHVYLPVMFIQSNAANLSVNGVHGLDQKILYNIKVNAGQVLGQQFKKHNPDLVPLPAKNDGFINLYYTIYGTTKDFKYELNKKGVLSSMDQSRDIKNRIYHKLESEFGNMPEWLEPEEWQDIPEFIPGSSEEGVRFLDPIKKHNGQKQ